MPFAGCGRGKRQFFNIGLYLPCMPFKRGNARGGRRPLQGAWRRQRRAKACFCDYLRPADNSHVFMVFTPKAANVDKTIAFIVKFRVKFAN
jgi:hypothetical protein